MEPLQAFHPQIARYRQAIAQARSAASGWHPEQWVRDHPHAAWQLAANGLQAAAVEGLLTCPDSHRQRLFASCLLDPAPMVAPPLTPPLSSLLETPTRLPSDPSQLQTLKDLAQLGWLNLNGGSEHVLEAIEQLARHHPQLAIALMLQALGNRVLKRQTPTQDFVPLQLQPPTLIPQSLVQVAPHEHGWTVNGRLLDLPWLDEASEILVQATAPDGWVWLTLPACGQTRMWQDCPISTAQEVGHHDAHDLWEAAWLMAAALALGSMAATLNRLPENSGWDLVDERRLKIVAKRETGCLMLRQALHEPAGDDRLARTALAYWWSVQAADDSCWGAQQIASALGYPDCGPALSHTVALRQLATLLGAEPILALRLIAPWLLGATLRR